MYSRTLFKLLTFAWLTLSKILAPAWYGRLNIIDSRKYLLPILVAKKESTEVLSKPSS